MKMYEKNCYTIENDYNYKLPHENYKQSFKKSNGVGKFRPDINGIYDFKEKILNNLEIIKIENIESGSKKNVNDLYKFERYIEFKICKLKNNDMLQDIEECKVFNLLLKTDDILIRTEKIAVYNKKNELLYRLDTREEVIEFAKNELKEKWKDYKKDIDINGRELYKPYLILFKKEANINNVKNYYLTATIGSLDKHKNNYEIRKKKSNRKTNDIEKLDIFFINNERKASSDMFLLFEQLKEHQNIFTFSIDNKKENILRYKTDYKFDNVMLVYEDDSIEVNNNPLDTEQKIKNVVATYQKNNITQGTNAVDFTLCIQNCHAKIDVMERIQPTSYFDVIVIIYIEACYRAIIQSSSRINRGFNLKYKAMILFIDFEREKELMENIYNYYSINYDYAINRYNVLNSFTKLKDRKRLAQNVIKHISDRHNKLNENNDIELYTFNVNKLIKDEDKRIKYDSKDIMYKFLELQKEYIKNNPKKGKLSLRLASEMLGIPKDTINRALKGD